VALAFVTLAFAGAAEADTPEGGEMPGVTITVNPDDNLAASQSVAVSGNGFGNSRATTIRQCAATSSQPCTAPLSSLPSNPVGGFSTTVTVTRTFSPEGGGPTVDCLTTACVIEAANDLGSYAHHHLTFSGPAAVTTSPATAVTVSAATLNGTVNPRGLATDTWFEYSTSPDLAQPTSTTPMAIGSGTTAVSVAQDVSGLAADTTFYFRAVANRSGVVARGDIASFRTSAVAGPGPEAPPDVDAPLITRAAVDRVWALGSGLTSLTGAGRTAKRGTTFRYALSEPATVTIAIARVLPGRRVGRRCAKPSRTNRRRRRCNRYKRAVVLTRAAQAGANETPFSGRWLDSRNRRRALTPGRFRATITATDAAGNASTPTRLNFRVVPR
jgi:hypothetical protein